jgi:hypothetical protein
MTQDSRGGEKRSRCRAEAGITHLVCKVGIKQAATCGRKVRMIVQEAHKSRERRALVENRIGIEKKHKVAPYPREGEVVSTRKAQISS